MFLDRNDEVTCETLNLQAFSESPLEGVALSETSGLKKEH